MKTIRITAALLALLVALTGFAAVSLAAPPDAAAVAGMTEKTAAWLLEDDEPGFGSEWIVIALAQSGADAPDAYYTTYLTGLAAHVKDADGLFATQRHTDYAAVVLTLTALGLDPADFAGRDILEPLGDYDAIVAQGVNGACAALWALDAGDYDSAIRGDLVAYILTQEISGGGFGYEYDGAFHTDVDTTAMVLQALWPYRDENGVRDVIDRAVAYLKSAQLATAGFGFGSDSPDSIEQVIIALCVMGVNPATAADYLKDGKDMVSALTAFYLEDGGFYSPWGAADEANEMASYHGLRALTAYARLTSGRSLYDMGDTAGRVAAVITAIAALPQAVTADDADAIGAAKAAYDALAGYQRDYVTNYARLTAALDALDALDGGDVPSPPTGTASGATAVLALLAGAAIAAALLASRRSRRETAR